MSVGLAIAGLDYQVTLYFTAGNCINTIRIEREELIGQAAIIPAPIIPQRTSEHLLSNALSPYNYSALVN